MKISDFELGKKYIRKSRTYEWHVKYEDKVLIFIYLSHSRFFIPFYDDISADDWIELNEAENNKDATEEHEDDCPIKKLIALLELMDGAEKKEESPLEFLIKSIEKHLSKHRTKGKH